jgi:hypothetical protein
MTDKQIARMEKSLSNDLNTKVTNFSDFSDGFSFTVETELDAYKAAHKYQFCRETSVKEAPAVDGWLVQVYK